MKMEKPNSNHPTKKEIYKEKLNKVTHIYFMIQNKKALESLMEN